MIHSIDTLLTLASRQNRKTIAVAAAHDTDVLHAVIEATRRGMIAPILIGDDVRIRSLLAELGEAADGYRIESAPDSISCARRAVELVATKQASLLMKGLISTSELMHAVVSREYGLRTNRLISHVMLYEVPHYPKLLALTDGGMIPCPDLAMKADILENAAELLTALGYDSITAACICGAEFVNPKISATVDADALSRMTDRWARYNMRVIGPVGLDLAISKSACEHKGYAQEGCGDADILLVPTYEVGNVISKTLNYFTPAKCAGVIVGAKAPIVLVSRADSADSKLQSIALACLLTEQTDAQRKNA